MLIVLQSLFVFELNQIFLKKSTRISARENEKLHLHRKIDRKLKAECWPTCCGCPSPKTVLCGSYRVQCGVWLWVDGRIR